MAAPKRRPKQAGQPAPPQKPSLAGLPVPFTSAPSRLAPLLDGLDKSCVNIIHIDGHPVEVKRQIHRLSLAVNLTILAVAVWRVCHIAPTYWALVTDSSLMVPFGLDHWKVGLWTLLSRFALILLDYTIFQLVRTWPLGFFLGTQNGRWANPFRWRYSVGFQPKEVVVRRSRRWGVEQLLSKPGPATPKKRPNQPAARAGSVPQEPATENAAVFEKKVRPAVDLNYLVSKTGYLMLGPEYDLDYHAMTVASRLIRDETLSWLDVGAQVLVWLDSGVEGGSGQWLAWDAHRTSESMPHFSRASLSLILGRLKKMGKEELFGKWIDLVETEGSKPGPFTEQRQMEISLLSTSLFSDYGLNFYAFMDEISKAMETKGVVEEIVELGEENEPAASTAVSVD